MNVADYGNSIELNALLNSTELRQDLAMFFNQPGTSDTTVIGDGPYKTMTLPKVPSFSSIELPETAIAVLSHRAYDCTLGPRLNPNSWDMSEVNDDMIRADLAIPSAAAVILNQLCSSILLAWPIFRRPGPIVAIHAPMTVCLVSDE